MRIIIVDVVRRSTAVFSMTARKPSVWGFLGFLGSSPVRRSNLRLQGESEQTSPMWAMQGKCRRGQWKKDTAPRGTAVFAHARY